MKEIRTVTRRPQVVWREPLATEHQGAARPHTVRSLNAKEWSAAYDASADALQRLMQTTAILCDVPEDVLLALAGDDFTNFMNEVADISLKFAETQR